MEHLDADQAGERAVAAQTLGELGVASALPKLRRLVEDADPNVAASAKRAVKYIEYKESLEE